MNALGAAEARGVSTRVVVGGIGERYDWPHVVPLRRAGVIAARFLPPRLFPNTFALNCRTHLKILLIDSEEAFIGGMNLVGREVACATGRRKACCRRQRFEPFAKELPLLRCASAAAAQPLAFRPLSL